MIYSSNIKNKTNFYKTEFFDCFLIIKKRTFAYCNLVFFAFDRKKALPVSFKKQLPAQAVLRTKKRKRKTSYLRQFILQYENKTNSFIRLNFRLKKNVSGLQKNSFCKL
jgi:hypothetical protein